MNCILPPNKDLCLGGDANGDENSMGLAPASSRHQGGIYALMGDGSVVFLTDSIEAGDIHHTNVWSGGTGESVPGAASPYGAVGRTRNACVARSHFGTTQPVTPPHKGALRVRERKTDERAGITPAPGDFVTGSIGTVRNPGHRRLHHRPHRNFG